MVVAHSVTHWGTCGFVLLSDGARVGGVVMLCCSVSVCRLVCLAYDALREVIDSDASSRAAGAMQSAITELFQLFCDVVPFYHRQRIATAPLHAGTHLYTVTHECQMMR